MSLHVGEAIGDYHVIGIIGAGGMGQVFQVEHKITKRKEAMKVLIADLADDTQVQRFKREIEVQARLNHPNIAAVHNAFRLKDRMVLVLEFVEGQTLENLLKHGRPELESGINYVRQTLEALDYAHQSGVIHRDVSPANLMITENGLVKLMDFGVAKSLGDLRLTDGGAMIGTLYYMSPEQVKGSTDPDPRSDIYSAGAILYEIVTGKKPFDYADRFSLMVAQVEEQPRLPSLIDPGARERPRSPLFVGQRFSDCTRYSQATDGGFGPQAGGALPEACDFRSAGRRCGGGDLCPGRNGRGSVEPFERADTRSAGDSSGSSESAGKSCSDTTGLAGGLDCSQRFCLGTARFRSSCPCAARFVFGPETGRKTVCGRRQSEKRTGAQRDQGSGNQASRRTSSGSSTSRATAGRGDPIDGLSPRVRGANAARGTAQEGGILGQAESLPRQSV
jgi:serine/threonine protein kinase